MLRLVINIATIAIEICLIFILFLLINWCFNKLYQQIIKLSFLKKFKDNATIIRRNIRRFTLLLGVILSAIIIAFNLTLIFNGNDPLDYSLRILRKIPPPFLNSLGIVLLLLIEIFLIIVLSRMLISFTHLISEELLLNADNLTETQQKRRQTITPLLQNFTKYFIYFGAGILLLETLGIDPGPILAGAGILGFAIGLGAQNLINDIVSGFFILFENYYLVGDYIETDHASGYVEAIELRTTRIRHYLGQVYILRNGDIVSITNFSKDFIYAYVEVGVDYATNLDMAQEIIERIGRKLKEENDDILEPTKVDGIKEFGDIRLSIYTVTKVKPGKHIQVKRILRQMLKEEFDRKGIYIPIGETSDKPDWANKAQQK